MSYVQVGACPRCGAPMYSPVAWWGVIPPSPIRACGCFQPRYRVVINDNTNTYRHPADEGILERDTGGAAR